MMFGRQKALLLMLYYAQRPVRRTELMKWSFLLRFESKSGGGNSFYDFVPYKFGPFSFALYQELGNLEATNFVTSHDEAWTLNPGVAKSIAGVAYAVESDVKRIVRDFGRLSKNELIDYVYHRFPSFTVNSEIKKLAIRPTTQAAVFTAGYEGKSIDTFLRVLVESGIERLIDVRSNPVARRYGFHKSTLKRLVNRLGIDYRHFGELGIESEVRQLFPADGDRTMMFDNYVSNTLAKKAAVVSEVARLMHELASVLVCMESDPACCHRSYLAKAVVEQTDLPIVHLGYENG